VIEAQEERKVLESNEVTEDKANEGIEGTVGEGPKRGHKAFLNADVYQAAILNKMLPPGFKIEILEIVQRNYEYKIQQQKKAKQHQELMLKKQQQQMAAAKHKHVAPPTPAPIAAMNAAKKMPTTLGG
jgi:guanylate kinase